MTRDEVIATVKKHIMDVVEDLPEDQIDATKSMKELGINSLDVVDVVSCSMRELKIKVPRTELSKLTNIDELVDLLHRTVTQKERAAIESSSS